MDSCVIDFYFSSYEGSENNIKFYTFGILRGVLGQTVSFCFLFASKKMCSLIIYKFY